MVVRFAGGLQESESIGLALTKVAALHGKGPYLLSMESQAFKLLMKIPGLAAHQTWLDKQLDRPADDADDEADRRTTAMSHFKPQVSQKALDRITASFGEGFLPVIDGVPSVGRPPRIDEVHLMAQLMHPQAFASLGDHHEFNLNPHGLDEILMVTEGGCIVMGLPAENVPGETLQATNLLFFLSYM